MWNLHNSPRISSGRNFAYTKPLSRIHRDNGKRSAFVSEKSHRRRRRRRPRTSVSNVAAATIFSDLRRRIAVVTTRVGNNGLRLRVQAARESRRTKKNVYVSENVIWCYRLLSVYYRFNIGEVMFSKERDLRERMLTLNALQNCYSK